MNKVPMFDYLRHHQRIKPEIDAAIERVLQSGMLILGKEVASFEEQFAGFLGMEKSSCVGVNSGTDALTIGLRALGIGAGDEVVTVANTAVPTVSAIREVGAMPVFCDIDPVSCLLDLTQIEACITPKTRAIIAVHLFGNVVDIPALQAIVGERDIAIIEDCAQAHGAELKGKKVGTMGDIGAFSFYPTKNLGAYGDAGVVCSKDQQLVDKMRRIRMYGFANGHYAEEEGVNSRLDELQAAILQVKLRYLPEQLQCRRQIAAYYDEQLAPELTRLQTTPGALHAYHLYVIKVSNRTQVRQRLSDAGVASGIHYAHPIHLMRGYRFLHYHRGSLPQTEAMADCILSLPMFPELTQPEQKLVCDHLNQWVRSI